MTCGEDIILPLNAWLWIVLSAHITKKKQRKLRFERLTSLSLSKKKSMPHHLSLECSGEFHPVGHHGTVLIANNI